MARKTRREEMQALAEADSTPRSVPGKHYYPDFDAKRAEAVVVDALVDAAAKLHVHLDEDFKAFEKVVKRVLEGPRLRAAVDDSNDR